MRAVEHLKALCCLGLPPESATIALTPLLHEIVPHDGMRFGVLAHVARPPGGVPDRSDSVAPYRQGPSFGPLPALIAERKPAGIFLNLPARDRNALDKDSLHFRLGLDATIGEGGTSYAILELSRPRAALLLYDRGNQAFSIRLRPWLVRALRPRSQACANEPFEQRFGVVGMPVLSAQAILTASGDVVHQSGAAEHLFSTLEGRGRRSAPPPLAITKLDFL